MTVAAENPRQPLLDRQLDMLSELAELGMEVARSVARQAAEGAAVDRGVDLPLAYSRAARAVRLALMLQARLIGAEQAGEAAFPAPDPAAVEARKAKAAHLVEGFVREEHPDDEETVERLMAEAAERLDDEDLHGDILDQPMSQIVALICDDLRLSAERVTRALELFDDPGPSPRRAGPRGLGKSRPKDERPPDEGISEVMWIGDPPRYCRALDGPVPPPPGLRRGSSAPPP